MYPPQFPATTGVLFTNSLLDYELYTSYQINVTATDGGSPPRSGSTSIAINVADENDNNPVFSMSTYEWTITENSPSSSRVGNLIATDFDSTTNGEIIYTLLEGTNAFEVDNSSGIVTVRNSSLLDHELVTSYSFLVEARDTGVPSRATQALVSILFFCCFRTPCSSVCINQN